MLFNDLFTRKKATEAEKTIMEYLENHPNTIEKLTIQELAARTYSSNATIIRFARKLGFSGFRELKVQLIKLVEQQNYALSEINPDMPFHHETSIEKISQDIMLLTQQTLIESYQTLSKESLFAATKLLYQAERIFIFAAGDSEIRAQSFQNKLWKINKYPILANARNENEVNAANITSQDCAFFISYTTKAKQDYQVATYLHDKKVPLLLLSARQDTEMAQLMNVVLKIPHLESDERGKIATFSSQTAIEYCLNVLFAALFQIDYKENLARQEERIGAKRSERTEQP
ncbi:MurR/RpiR family transcriptional regulator [Listeria ilorinensis]|uniref:MurR/RpiR family transcriptional regulator n=1 Tax=Listeria ilorinensis TaxID=2867439 RepID=UPI001EF4C62A|nr:MurR/RpiR family transcriptional regulator [Listeria ilorinensis]